MQRLITKVLSAHPNSVPAIRHQIAQFAAGKGATREQTADIGLAVSEAVTNAILHGYRGRPGEVRVAAAVTAGALTVLVTDDGVGLDQPAAQPGLGVGWPLIASMTADFAVRSAIGGGTEIEMQFRI